MNWKPIFAIHVTDKVIYMYLSVSWFYNLFSFFFFFFFLIWVLRLFQENFTCMELMVHQRWAKTGEPGGKPPDHP